MIPAVSNSTVLPVAPTSPGQSKGHSADNSLSNQNLQQPHWPQADAIDREVAGNFALKEGLDKGKEKILAPEEPASLSEITVGKEQEQLISLCNIQTRRNPMAMRAEIPRPAAVPIERLHAPCYDFSSDLNLLSSQMSFTDWKRVHNLLHIHKSQSALRETSALKIELLQRQIKVITDLEQKKISYDQVSDVFSKEIDQIRENHLRNFDRLLAEQKDITEDGMRVDLSRERRLEQKERFIIVLNQCLTKSEIDMRFDTHVPLQAIKETFEDRLRSYVFYQEMLDGKLTEQDKIAFLEKNFKCFIDAEDLKLTKLRIISPPTTNIWLACERGDIGYIRKEINNIGLLRELFWKHKTDCVNRRSPDGYSSMHFAAYHGHLDVIKFLLENKASPEIREISLNPDPFAGPLYYQPIHRACQTGFIPVVEFLLEQGIDVNVKGDYGRTPLHMAVFNRQYELVQFLLRRGANINARAEWEKTPLFYAINHIDIPMVKLLVLDGDLNVLIKDRNNETPLASAFWRGNVEVIRLLLGHSSYKNCSSEEHAELVKSLEGVSQTNKEIKSLLEELKIEGKKKQK